MNLLSKKVAMISRDIRFEGAGLFRKLHRARQRVFRGEEFSIENMSVNIQQDCAAKKMDVLCGEQLFILALSFRNKTHCASARFDHVAYAPSDHPPSAETVTLLWVSSINKEDFYHKLKI